MNKDDWTDPLLNEFDDLDSFLEETKLLEQKNIKMKRVTRISPISGKINTMTLPITDEELRRWQNGEMIQKVFPKLTPDQREFIMTGIMPDE